MNPFIVLNSLDATPAPRVQSTSPAVDRVCNGECPAADLCHAFEVVTPAACYSFDALGDSDSCARCAHHEECHAPADFEQPDTYCNTWWGLA